MRRQVSHTIGVARREILLMECPSSAPAVVKIKNSIAHFGVAWHVFCAPSSVGRLTVVLMNHTAAVFIYFT